MESRLVGTLRPSSGSTSQFWTRKVGSTLMCLQTYLFIKLHIIECYDYSVAIDWNQHASSSTPKPYGGKSVKLSVNVKDPQEATSMTTLTQTFASLGDYPMLLLKNGTNVYTFGPSNFEVFTIFAPSHPSCVS